MQNPIPIILGIIIVQLVWMISFFVKVVVNTGQEEAVSPSGIISVKSVEIDNVKCQSFLNYIEFRTNHEPYMVHGKVQIKFKFQISNIKTFDIESFGIHLVF